MLVCHGPPPRSRVEGPDVRRLASGSLRDLREPEASRSSCAVVLCLEALRSFAFGFRFNVVMGSISKSCLPRGLCVGF
jgi:hypothetical protein